MIQNPAKLNKEQVHSLEKLSREFPYFQSIRPLLLKGLKDQESFRYNQELKTTAAYTTDRNILFDFITSDLFRENKNLEFTKKKSKSDIPVIDPKEVKVLPRMAMDDAVRMKMEEAEDVLDPALFSVRNADYTKEQDTNIDPTEPQKEDKTPEEITQINKPLDFDKKESHSFAEWLKLTSLTPINQENDQNTNASIPETQEEQPSKSLDQKDKFNLIDEFIANNPKIKPSAKNTPSRNLAKKNMVPTDELMTETLAKVYLAQKNYKKAIQAYNILILKNPEKSGFFADQIRAIKKLQENK